MTPAVELRTERLLLRRWRLADIDAYAALCADPDVMRFVGGTMDRITAWRAMAAIEGHWNLRGFGQFAVERRSDAEFLGRVGPWQPEGWPGLEIGWVLARHAWGAGYATEAVRAVLDWLWSAIAPERVISLIDPANTPSIAVAQRLGMERTGEQLLFGGKPVDVYGRRRPAP